MRGRVPGRQQWRRGGTPGAAPVVPKGARAVHRRERDRLGHRQHRRPDAQVAWRAQDVQRAGGQVKAAPSQIKLWFTGALEQAYSRVEVLDAAGKRMDLGDGAVDGANRALLRVSVPALPPGNYRVVWRVVSVDSHVTEGQFSFTVVR